MRWQTYIFLLLALCFPVAKLSAQKNKKDKKNDEQVDENKQKVFVTIGPEVNIVIPTDFGARKDVFYGDTLFRFSPNVSYRLGACLRFDFSRTISLQTGLYYISRSYTAKVGKSNPIRTEIEQEYFSKNLNYIGFEVPIMALFYVQLGRKWFMNNAVGVSLDFYPSSIIGNPKDSSEQYVIYGGRNALCMPALKANIGFEFRTDKAGYFYLGGQFHRPFSNIMDGFIERSKPVPFDYQSSRIPQSGTYFSIDFKYFLPTGKPNKWTANR